MLDTTGKKLLRLLQPAFPTELRCAAARVLGEVGPRDPELARTLCDLFGDSDPLVRFQVLRTVGQLHLEQALPRLLARVGEGGPEAEVAAQAAAHLGPKGTKALQDLMGKVAPGLRRRIAAALGVGGTPSAGVAAVDALLDSDPGVVDAAARSLISEIPLLSEAQRKGLADHVLELVNPKKKTRLPAASEAALLRLLAALGDPRGAATFWARLESSHPPELRAAALGALGALPLPESKEKLALVFAAAADPDFRVAAPALMMLKALPVGDRNLRNWLGLLEALDVAARRLALDKLAGKDTAEVAEALLRQLRYPDQTLRQEALKRLGEMKHGRKAFAEALLEAESADEAWMLARAQVPFAAEYATALRGRIISQACRFLEAADRRTEPLLLLLREIDARALRDRLAERAQALRKKKAYAEALAYLRVLTRDPACAEAIRFEMACCALKLSGHDLAVEARQADPCLQQLARLIHSHEVDPADRLKQARWLGPEDLFYLGFHFVEGDKPEREFGAAALRLAIQRSPRSKLARDARSKLRSAGLD
jgi:hypothetical protein